MKQTGKGRKILRVLLLHRLDVLNRKIIDLNLGPTVMTQPGLLQVVNEELSVRTKGFVVSGTERVHDIKPLLLQVNAHRIVVASFVMWVVGCKLLEHGKHHLHVYNKKWHEVRKTQKEKYGVHQIT